MDLYRVLTDSEQRLDIEFPGTEHVICPAHLLTVDENYGECVQTFTSQQDMLTRRELCLNLEISRPDPVGLANPQERRSHRGAQECLHEHSQSPDA